MVAYECGWGHTVNDPGLDLRRLDLERGCDDRVGDVTADVLVAEGGEGDKANLALQLCAVELCARQRSDRLRDRKKGEHMHAPYLANAPELLLAHSLYCARPSFKKILSSEKSSWSFAATTASRRKSESKSK